MSVYIYNIIILSLQERAASGIVWFGMWAIPVWYLSHPTHEAFRNNNNKKKKKKERTKERKNNFILLFMG